MSRIYASVFAGLSIVGTAAAQQTLTYWDWNTSSLSLGAAYKASTISSGQFSFSPPGDNTPTIAIGQGTTLNMMAGDVAGNALRYVGPPNSPRHLTFSAIAVAGQTLSNLGFSFALKGALSKGSGILAAVSYSFTENGTYTSLGSSFNLTSSYNVYSYNIVGAQPVGSVFFKLELTNFKNPSEAYLDNVRVFGAAQPAPVPEPFTIALGIAGAGMYIRRRRAK